MAPAHYKDLRELYTKRMETHGLGVALFHPIAAEDMRPPCCGYFDRNGDWNLICNLVPETEPPFHPTCGELGFESLEYMPTRSMEIGIEWQPKTASGTQEHVIAGSAETPDNQPAGAEADVKYTSANKFGAVLMTKKPITLTAYNDERLFSAWLEANRGELYKLHGAELKKYGMWLVTRTYTSKGASINAWSDANKASVISTKAKAAMLGELGEDLDWQDRLSSRDWSHYAAKTKQGLVVFMDGIDMSSFDWKFEGLKQNLPGAKGRNEDDRTETRYRAEEIARRKSVSGRPSVPAPDGLNGSRDLAALNARANTGDSGTTPASITKPPTWAQNQIESMMQEDGSAARMDTIQRSKSKDESSVRKSALPARSQSQRNSSSQPRSEDDPWWYDDGRRQSTSRENRGPTLSAPQTSEQPTSRITGQREDSRSSKSSRRGSRSNCQSLSPSPLSQGGSPPGIGAVSPQATHDESSSGSSRRLSIQISVTVPGEHHLPPSSETRRRSNQSSSNKRSSWHSSGSTHSGQLSDLAVRNGSHADEETLRDTGLLQPFARSLTPIFPTRSTGSLNLDPESHTSTSRTASSSGSTMETASSNATCTTATTVEAPVSCVSNSPSLRRETRSISQDIDGKGGS